MAKMRGIKPETWTDSKFVRLSPLARLLFLGMWNLACDNGHVEDDVIELKIRLLPIDNCDVAELVEELVSTGQVERHDGFLKVRKLSVHQRIDVRYLTLCEWCSHDEHTTFSEADKPVRTKGAQRADDGHTSGPQSAPEGEGEKKVRGKKKTSSSSGTAAAAPRTDARRGSRLPEPFVITADMVQWARRETPGLDHRAVTARFEDYWRAVPGAKGVKLDWEATWRNWLRREFENATPAATERRPGTSVWDNVVSGGDGV